MIASVYIKDGNIHIYNENRRFTSIGGLAYELGRPLLNFVCYEPERFDDAFSMIASALDYPFAYLGINELVFLNVVKQSMAETQKQEIYVYFYNLMLIEFIYAFVESPRQAIIELDSKIPGAVDKLAWTMDFEWPVSQSQFVYADNEKRLYRSAMDAVALMLQDLKRTQDAMIFEIDLLISLRENAESPVSESMEYLYMLEALHQKHSGRSHFLEKPFRAFYGVTKPPEIVELYEIDSIKDLFRFEFIKMIEHDIFIKKCKNCERFFIPRRRADAEYCDRIYAEGPRRCSEIGAMLRYERKVAENPILEAYSKAYKRFNSRTRAKKMTQSEFLRWSEEARERRDRCMAGEMPFEEFSAWLEQGRIRKIRSASK